jgi:two-component system, NarL family, response regulator NreC
MKAASEHITAKEKEILLLIAEGFSGKQIAQKTGLAENTVANHRKSLLKKTGCKNMAELIRYSITNQIIK